jgi:hypothetical protein
VLAHAPRQVSVSLIFDVRQKQTMKIIGITSLLLAALPSAQATEFLHFENNSPNSISYSVEGLTAIRTVSLSPYTSVTFQLVGSDPIIELREGTGFGRSKARIVVVDMNSESLEPGMKSGEEDIALVKATITVSTAREKITITRDKNQK